MTPLRTTSPLEKKAARRQRSRSEEHTSELQSQSNLVCRLLLEKKEECYRQLNPEGYVRIQMPSHQQPDPAAKCSHLRARQTAENDSASHHMKPEINQQSRQKQA